MLCYLWVSVFDGLGRHTHSWAFTESPCLDQREALESLLVSLDRFKGKSAGNHRFENQEICRFPVIFPLNQFFAGLVRRPFPKTGKKRLKN